MAYARFIENDVYVYLDVSGYFTCCACALNEVEEDQIFPASRSFYTTDDLIEHLREHQKKGDHVQDYVFERLLDEKEENDEWIKNYDAEVEARKREEANQKVRDTWQIAKEELGYEHPGPEKFDWEAHDKAWKAATKLYESRKTAESNKEGS